jgi:hypothetical protein
MLTAVIALVVTLAVIAVFLFVAVVVGIHLEPPHQELSGRAEGPLAAIARRMLGVYVGKPTSAMADQDREECLAGHSTEWRNADGEVR